MKRPNTLASALRRRIAATRRVWQPGGAHLVLLTPGLSLQSDGSSVTSLENPPPPVIMPCGFIDHAAPEPTVDEVLRVAGWAATSSGACARVELEVNGRPVGRARLGLWRPDVADGTGVDAAVLAGFEARIDVSELSLRDEVAVVHARATGMDGVTFELTPVRVGLRAGSLGTGPTGDHVGDGGNHGADQPAPANGDGKDLDVPPALARSPRCAAASSSRRLRILIFTHQLDYGGAQLFLTELLEKMCRQAPLEGAVISLADGPTRGVFERLGFEVHTSPGFPVSSARDYEARLEELSAWIADRSFDVAFGNTVVAFPGGDACFRLGLPTVWSIHESYTLPLLWATYGEGLDPAVRARAEAALRGTPVIAFTCESTRSCYERSVAPARCVVLPYGIDLEQLDRRLEDVDPRRERERHLIGDEDTMILCMATITPHKGQVSLIRAFASIADRHPQASLVLVGGRNDPHTETARAAAKTEGVQDRVRIEPVSPDVLLAYASADLMVSASDIESTPRSMLEAMAIGLPVLAVSVFGVPELITDGETGWLCEPRDVQGLAEKLDYVLSVGPAERRRVARAARELIEREYRSEICSRAWLDLLLEVASPKSRQGEPRAREKAVGP